MREFHEVRKDISGDPEAAAPYMGLARTLLGQVKTRMQAGGLSQLSRSITLPDGTIISVLSRLGQDTVRIFAVVPAPPPPLPFFQEVPPEQPQPEEFPELPIPPQPQPYMWIGARYRWEDYGNVDVHHTNNYGGLLLVAVEPGNNGVLMGDSPQVWASETAVSETTQTIDLVGLQNQFSGQYPTDWGAPAGVHNFGIYDQAHGNATFMFSKNGLRLYSVASSQNALTDPDAFTPFDPQAAAGATRFVPTDPSINLPPEYSVWAPTHLWDTVVVLDPWEAEGIPPFDSRKSTAWSRELLKRSGVKTGLSGVLGGNYEILIGAYGEYRLGSDRATQQSPYLPSGEGFHYDYEDFREHLTLPFAAPLRIEIEVRMGKLPYMSTQRFTIEVPAYDSYQRTTLPYGGSDGDGCAYYNGGNPLTMNWYSGAILVNPLAGTCTLKPGYVSRIFQPAAYSLDKLRSKRYPIDFYYMTLGNSSATQAGFMLYKVMDIQCCSYFGLQLEMQQRLAADVQAAAGSLAANRVYRYDNASNSFTDVGFYNGLTDFRTMADPLAAASLAQCHMPIFCGSDNSISPNYWGGPYSGSCCADTYFGN